MIKGVLEKVFGTQNTRTLAKLSPLVEKVNTFEPQMEKLTSEQLRAKTEEFRGRFAKGETLDDLLPEAFAVVREASKRTVKMRHFDSQIYGGIVLHQGKIAEMATGEGKTLVATLPLYLNALAGKGCHLVTVNDYLAQRDRNWMGPIYESLGLTVGAIQHGTEPSERQGNYACDITYGTNNEFGFDYLRDNMVSSLSHRVQRGHHYAIVDEVDSILIDEARTPLIISGPAEESTDKYYRIDRIIPGLNAEAHYKLDEKARNVSLTENGIRRCEELLGIENLYENTQIDIIHHINQALRAHVLFKIDEEYVVKDNQVIIVDEFTGRLMPGRRFSDGLHQALEAKEGVKIERENQTLATVTFQNYFRMYGKLAGMTGTAATEAVEFDKIYKLDVVVVPTNRPVVRHDHADCIYRTEKEKFEAVAKEIIELHKAGQPALVGTISIERSERLSKILKRYNIPHNVLNAKYHEKEAEIVSQAGQPGRVTIATNMAGRGTDIVLGEGVAQKGGLAVIGTERHESRRIDNQLRGRSGRQGDPGMSKFFISLEDDLMRIFAAEWMSGFMQKIGMQEGEEIQHPMLSRAIERAQKKVEGRNFEIRKHLLEYDDVMNRQRELIYAERDLVLKGGELKTHIFEMVENVLENMLAVHVHPDMSDEEKDADGLKQALKQKFGFDMNAAVDENMDDLDCLRDEVLKKIREHYDIREKEFGAERMRFLEQYILLQMIDSKWKDHLHALDNLKEGIGLRAYGQIDPLIAYKKEAFEMFDAMTENVKDEATSYLFRIQAVREEKMTSVFAQSSAEYSHPQAQSISSMPAPKAASPEKGGRPSLLQGGHAGRDDSRESRTPVRREEPKVGRNDPCPCGSGKKYKKCHGTAV